MQIHHCHAFSAILKLNFFKFELSFVINRCQFYPSKQFLTYFGLIDLFLCEYVYTLTNLPHSERNTVPHKKKNHSNSVSQTNGYVYVSTIAYLVAVVQDQGKSTKIFINDAKRTLKLFYMFN